MKKLLAIISVICCALTINAQTVTFETADYKNVGVYDMWEASPFRTGQLQGNAAVVDNPFKDDINTTDKVLGVQRSRFGSNMFGARIDLNETFELNTTVKYVHVLIHKPGTSRVMLMGLGKHRTTGDNSFWSYQTNDVEQFWERCMPTIDVQDNQWFDAVFAVKGAGDIDIYSLVVVVDATSPHNLTDDFIAYVDQVEVNNTPTSRTALAGDYPICLAKNQTYTRTDRKLNSVSLRSADGTFTANTSGNLVYTEVFTPTFNAKAGETVTPSVNYTGSWMHSYVYVDWGHDGNFSYDVAENGGVLAGSDLVSFSRLGGKDVNGTDRSSDNNNIVPAPFTIPAGTPSGVYRMRYKVDWNYADPAGNDGSSGSNYILDNGGGYIDVRLNVHDDNITIARTGGLNGDIVHADGTEFDTELIPFGQAYTIYMRPAPGFSVDSLIVRHGYNLDAEQMLHSTPQWTEEVVHASDFAADGSFTIPAAWVDGNINLYPEFLETASIVTFTYDYQWQGVSKHTEQHIAKIGDPMPAVNTSWLPMFTTAVTPDGIVTAELDGTTIVIEIEAEGLPFECYTTLNEVTQWYYLALKQKYICDQGTASYIGLTCDEPTENDFNFVWGFVGSPFDGFQIYNYYTKRVLATQLGNISANTGGNQWPITQDADNLPDGWYAVWNLTPSTYYNHGFYLSVQGQGNGAYKMNNRDDKLAFWTGGADAGSTFQVTALDFDPDHITTAAINADQSAVYDLAGRCITHATRGFYIQGRTKVIYK